MDHLYASSCIRVTNFQKCAAFIGPPCIIYCTAFVPVCVAFFSEQMTLLCPDDTVHIRPRRSVRTLVWFRVDDVHRDVRIRRRPRVADGENGHRSWQVETQVT